MKVENQLKTDKYNIYFFIKYLKERMNTNFIINICEKNIYDTKKVNEIVKGKILYYNTINKLNYNIFNRNLIKKSIIYIKLKKDEIDDNNINKLKTIKKLTNALIIEFDLPEKESIQVAKNISDRCIFGNINYEDKETKSNIALFGKVFEYDKKCEKNDIKVLAIIHTYNEEDIIENTVRYLLDQGIDVYISDNWSKDNTYQIVDKIRNELENKNSNRKIYLDRYPNEQPTEDVYNWTEQLKKTERISKTMNYDWFIHYDADEIRTSPWEDRNLLDTIKYVDYMGYNAIDNTVIDFRITEEDINKNTIFNKNEQYFEIGRRPGHFLQIKTWKKNKDIELASSGGHEAKFKNRKVYPLKILLKHYPLRNVEQALKKIFKDRLPRMEKEKKEKGWHIQYDNIANKEDFIYEKQNLHKFNENTRKNYLIEMLTGCGIDKQ